MAATELSTAFHRLRDGDREAFTDIFRSYQAALKTLQKLPEGDCQ